MTEVRQVSRTAKWLIVVGVILFLIGTGLRIAAATSGDCDTHYNHSGNIPGSYDYAEFYEDGQLVTTVETNGEDVFVNPAGWDAGEDWDQVNKCDYTETTTTTIATPPPSVTVDCLTLTVDAAEDQVIGVAIGDGFVEFEGSDSFTGLAGQSWAVYWNDQVIASGVFEECTTTTTVPETTTTTEGSTTSTLTETTTTTAPTTTTEGPTTTQPDEPVLPFTGISRAQMIGLLIAGLAAVGIGTVLVREFRS